MHNPLFEYAHCHRNFLTTHYVFSCADLPCTGLTGQGLPPGGDTPRGMTTLTSRATRETDANTVNILVRLCSRETHEHQARMTRRSQMPIAANSFRKKEGTE